DIQPFTRRKADLRRMEYLLYKYIVTTQEGFLMRTIHAKSSQKPMQSLGSRPLSFIWVMIPALLLAGWLGHQSSRYAPDHWNLLQGIGVIHSIGDCMVQDRAGQPAKGQKPHPLQDDIYA
ncbi:hypothetical protein, partial [Acidithiobacillus thiooxidans]